jgi:2-polyprenyl-3-methyl-5-hydroxy-6-metoxy-1,4-benzoquinol methylase
MTVFGNKYSASYDALYHDKDYKKECDFLEAVFRKHKKKVQTVLDLGCGTGGHAIILAKRGYKVTGVDRSKEMLEAAVKKSKDAGMKVAYHHSSIQDLKLNKKFDAVISMFAVMSYQTDNKALASACAVAKAHMKNNGIFIFDAWHGLGVMTDPPTERIREVRNKDNRIIRITKPQVNAVEHTVDTNFKVLTFDDKALTSETTETHKMRFLFPKEIEYFLQIAGFSKVRFCPFLKPEDRLSSHDWNMTVISQ